MRKNNRIIGIVALGLALAAGGACKNKGGKGTDSPGGSGGTPGAELDPTFFRVSVSGQPHDFEFTESGEYEVEDAAVVTTGPYRYVTHPNYIAVVGELLGVALMTGALIR